MATQLTARLGLVPRGLDDDGALVAATFGWLRESGIGFDAFFFDWYGGEASAARALAGPRGARYGEPGFGALRRRLATYDPAHPPSLALPYYRRDEPCSLLYDEIEGIWAAIAERDDWARFDAKLAAIGELRASNPDLAERGRAT
jgi:hypothetical protein